MNVNVGDLNHIAHHDASPTIPSTATSTGSSKRCPHSFKSKTSAPHFSGIWSKMRHNIFKLKFKLNPRLSDCNKPMRVADFSLQLPLDHSMRKHKGHHKREELQREVSLIQRSLDDEEKMHKIVQQAHDREDATPYDIPNYISPKMEELLAELTEVDNVIFQLESQIKELESKVKREQEVTYERKSKLVATGRNDNNAITSDQNNNMAACPPRATKTKPESDRMGRFETKALHLITKAINGDYNLGLSRSMNSKAWPQESSSLNRNEAEVQETILLVQRSGTPNPPASSPRDFGHPTPKTTDRNLAQCPRKSLSNCNVKSELKRQKWEPNKLSEKLVKCLILIYVRLIRTWRQAEREKGGRISRSIHSSLSFRAEGDSVIVPKESRQQDPYGIFKIENSVLRDIGTYKNLLVFSSSSLNPKCISTSSSISLFQKLRGLLDSLQKVDLRSLTEQQKLAFWINIYNACLMNGYLDYGAPSSPEKLLAMINKATLNIGGNVISARMIEHCILRKPPSSITKEIEAKDNREAVLGELYGVETWNPNVVFALSNGNCSSPAVKVYTSEGLVAELERSKIEYLQASITVTSTKKIMIPELLVRNSFDFAKYSDSLMQWVCHQLPASVSLRKSIVGCFRSHSSAIVEKLPYELEFQYLLDTRTWSRTAPWYANKSQ